MRAIVVASLVACASPPGPTTAAPPRSPPVTAAAAPMPPPPTPSYLASARIVAIGADVLVIDGDSGTLVKTDPDGAEIARLAIGRGAGLLAYDPSRAVAFVADRGADRIVVVDVRTMTVARSWKTPVEPFGVALVPDRTSLLVTSIADRVLVAYDAQSGVEQWRAALPSEPRAIAISPDGRRALIASAESALDVVALDTRRVTPIVYDLTCDRCANGSAFARGSAVLFLDEHRAIASFQREVPEAIETFASSMYSGGSQPPVTQHLAFLTFTEKVDQVTAQIVANQPRSMLWDNARDTLYVAGHASDTLLRLHGLTRGTTDEVGDTATDTLLRPKHRCGPDGLAQAADGTVYLWCGFSRSVVRLAGASELRESATLADSALTAEQHRGFVLFDSVNPRINSDGALACSTCHLEGRADGLSWKIGKQRLQTPALAGRLPGTHPFKWDASDKTLEASIAKTISRLGGSGLAADQTAALVAYLHTLPRPRVPTLDANAVARGKIVFDGEGGCTDCHKGARFTDNKTHRFEGSTLDLADTPSLVGLAATSPYYHDGSAATLDELVRGRGSVHGMGDLGALDAAQRADLAAYLASL